MEDREYKEYMDFLYRDMSGNILGFSSFEAARYAELQNRKPQPYPSSDLPWATVDEEGYCCLRQTRLDPADTIGLALWIFNNFSIAHAEIAQVLQEFLLPVARDT